jgi:hypothetical protein
MAAGMVMAHALETRAQSGTAIISILKEMETINNKAKKPHIPIAEQLKPRDSPDLLSWVTESFC